jgi:hypothetical protein
MSHDGHGVRNHRQSVLSEPANVQAATETKIQVHADAKLRPNLCYKQKAARNIHTTAAC